MKTKSCTLICFFLMFITFSGNSQEIIEKNYFDSDKKLGGDVILNNSIIKADGSKTYKIFEVESSADGDYYLNMWLMGCELGNFGSRKFQEYDLIINNDKQENKIKPEKINWHNVAFTDGISNEKGTVKLKKGLNQITFSCDAPAIPEIEFIRLSKDKFNSEISETNYNLFVDEIKKEIQERIKNPIVERDTSVTMSKGASALLDNPGGNYYYHLDATYKYTFYTTLYFSAGLQIFFTTQSNNFPHVLEVFSQNYTENYSWVATSNPNGTATINVNIPSSDFYFIRIRSMNQAHQGLVNLNVWDAFYYSDCVASGWAGFRDPHETPTTYNYFTSKISGDTRIWIEDDSGLPGKIRAWNDDYYGGGDFYWGLASRVKKDFSVRIAASLVSSYSSYTPTGIYDLYVMCQNSGTLGFPNLKSDDAIQTAPQSGVYNCISWSGGIDWDWYWPPNPYDPYYAGSPLASFDNFYSYAGRYGGCMTYSRSGATVSNSVVDLWYNPNYYGPGQGDYTHGSVTKPGNNHPHGYDWESKPGPQNRIFHPRNSLNSTATGGYGNVSNYYIPTSTKSAMLLDESIAKGLSVIENVELTAAEKNIVSNKINLLTINQKDEFENKYTAWKQTWEKPEIAMQSNPRMYAKSKEYNELIDYCKSQGKSVWPMIFDKFQQGDFFTINVLEDLTLAENQDVLDKVKKESSLKSTSESGAKIVRFPRTIAMKYIKELLKSSKGEKAIDEDGITYSNSFKFNVFPNPVNSASQISFNLPADSKVSAQVVDLNGRVMSIIINEHILAAGDYSYNLNVPATIKGICLVKLLVNNNVNVQLIVVQ